MNHRRPAKPSEGTQVEVLEVELAILHQLRLMNRYFRRLLEIEEPKTITGFILKQTGDSDMPLLPIDAGQTGIKITAVPQPAGAELPDGAQLSWTSNDPNFTVTADPGDPTGLTADVSIAAGATIGEAGVITLTATGTNTDGSGLNASGSLTLTVGAPPAQNVTGFVLTQTT